MSILVYRLLQNGLLLVLIVAAGCDQHQDPEPAPPPFTGQRVTIAVPTGSGFDETLRPVLDEWAAQTGATGVLSPYNFKSSDSGNLSAQLFGQADGQIRPGKPTVVIFPLTSLSELSVANGLLAIPKLQQATDHLDWLDVLSGLREHAASIGKRPKVIPISCPVLVCYYRADLLAKFGLSPPRTWDDYQYLLQILDRWAPGMTAVEPWNEDWRATMYLARAVSYATHPGNYSLFFDIRTGRPLIETPGFVRALEEAQAAIARMPVDVKRYTPADCRKEFLAGRAAMAITVEPDSIETSLSLRKLARPTSMRVTVGRLPGRLMVFNRTSSEWERPRDRKLNRPTLVFGGMAAGVVGTGAATQAAWNLLETVTGDQRTTAFGTAALSLCRASQTGDVSPQTGAGLRGAEQQGAASVVAENLRDPRLIVELPIIGREHFRAALTAGLNRVLNGSTRAAESLTTVAAKWRALSKTIGNDRIIDSYRSALGLSPRRKAIFP